MKSTLFTCATLLALFAPVAAQAGGAAYGGPGGGGYTPAPIQAPGQFNGGAINMPSRAAPAPVTQPAPVLRPTRR